MDTAVTGTAPGLRRDAIGLREVLFQSITDMAPGAAIAASIPAGGAWTEERSDEGPPPQAARLARRCLKAPRRRAGDEQ